MTPQPSEIIALALRILGAFDFSGTFIYQSSGLITGHVLNEFVREAAMPYLEDDSPDVRKEAVLAATQLLVHDPICGQTSVHSVEIVSDVLGKLLTVGITDACEFSSPMPC
jgi:FKBP12-rapamycin complex-associated protein